MKFDYKKADFVLTQQELDLMKEKVSKAHKTLHEKSGEGNEFLGWLDLPANYDKAEFERVKKAAEKIKANSDVLIVIGIGGSYLGAKAGLSMLTHTFYDALCKNKRKTPAVLFAGNSISSAYLCDLIEFLGDKDFSVNVISK